MFQLALERYLRSTKSPWQVGRDYERYVGYLREREGCAVTYHGIIHGFEDLGRDVLAEKDGTIEVIQCKRWAQHKEIHEKHVFQLFGTMTAARIENPTKTVVGTFTTTTRLSDRGVSSQMCSRSASMRASPRRTSSTPDDRSRSAIARRAANKKWNWSPAPDSRAPGGGVAGVGAAREREPVGRRGLLMHRASQACRREINPSVVRVVRSLRASQPLCAPPR